MKLRLFLTIAFTLAAATTHAELQAGAAKRSIVPPFPTHMGGFGDRMEFFEGVHDEIYARALVIDDGTTTIAIIGSGLMALDEELAAHVRDRVEAATDIPGANVMVSCVHNHSAPSYYQYKTDAEKHRARDFFAEQFADAVIEAYEKRVPAEIGYANGEIRGATSNRQQSNETVIDPQVGVLRVEEKEGRRIIATLFNFTGHPVIQGSENLLITGEWPGAAARTIEQVLGGIAIPTQGACGDVTVHRQGDPFLEIERLGRLVAGEVIKTVETIRPSDSVTIAAANVDFILAPKELPKVEDAKRDLDTAKKRLAQLKENEASRETIRAQEKRISLLSALRSQSKSLAKGTLERPDNYPASVQVIRIGEVVYIAVPGELFVEYALEMRQRIAQLYGHSTCLVGYANGYIGYFVTPRAHETGGYEASVARVEWGAARKMTEAALSLAAQVIP